MSILRRTRLSTIVTSCPAADRCRAVGHPQKPSPPSTMICTNHSLSGPLRGSSRPAILSSARFRPSCGAPGRVPRNNPRSPVSANKKERPYIPAVREAALREFRERVGEGFRFAPVVALIAAYDEEDCVGAVLDAIPAVACGLPVDILVVDDGSTDRTAEVVAKHDGVHLARLERNCGHGVALRLGYPLVSELGVSSPCPVLNCGHGVALRLGYQLVSELGGQFIVTLDADMQWDPHEIPTVLEPLATGEADFVIGSRVLGRAETDDAVRHAGVAVFARLVSSLTGVHVTDTSSGFRAMKAEITQVVPQVQVQYQTSELLIGAIYAGYRIAERPITMHKRLAGESKKGHNLLYGGRYARVILTTWGRERRRARRAGRRAGR